jgi:hypothetical protein
MRRPGYRLDAARPRTTGIVRGESGRSSVQDAAKSPAHSSMIMRRRDVFLVVTSAGVATALVGAAPSVAPAASAQLAARRDKRRPQYQPDSAEVQTFYRVNRYPAK